MIPFEHIVAYVRQAGRGGSACSGLRQPPKSCSSAVGPQAESCSPVPTGSAHGKRRSHPYRLCEGAAGHPTDGEALYRVRSRSPKSWRAHPHRPPRLGPRDSLLRGGRRPARVRCSECRPRFQGEDCRFICRNGTGVEEQCGDLSVKTQAIAKPVCGRIAGGLKANTI